MKRHFYNKREYFIDKETKTLHLKPEFHKMLLEKKLWGKFGFKKIGGSNISEVLKTDEYKSEFAAFVKISWLGMPILDEKYIKAGVIIEPKVLEILESKLAEPIKRFNPADYNYDYFAGQDPIIGGIPDGFIESKKYLLEIKTAQEKKFDSWLSQGVPISYQKQAQLYSYLMGVETFFIVATFLKEEDYINPETYPIKKRKLKSFKYTVNKDQVIDDIEKVKEWYIKHTTSGISPQYNDYLDGELLDWLDCSNEEEMKQLLVKWEKQGKYKPDEGK
ncbi:YqaJ viral recombinase family protein [Mycoplasma iguanae]|uniref:YqaJ viral recombinase family protein n=1 Tax=Mycoplasma iguanae TaxID=292461 RepID=A0ABY5R7P0_9MOLU|nr:YqaJ viral recombinase family protein [Mycoplasma iguanae]UVD81531.1 YqaJ viral recombinase family protein [Mycoplasma iguanae]